MLDKQQSHYINNVMRLALGNTLALFNGEHGEWQATIIDKSKAGLSVRLDRRLRAQDSGPDLWLVQAPIKAARMKNVVEKATELGVAAFVLVTTQNTAVSAVNVDRLRANAIEAAEQCGRLTVPLFNAPQNLDQLVDTWPQGRRLVFCDETRAAPPLIEALGYTTGTRETGAWGVLIGPEGGFTAGEAHRLRQQPFVTPVSLGPRILRADTAAISALSLWQAVAGDWRDQPKPEDLRDLPKE